MRRESQSVGRCVPFKCMWLTNLPSRLRSILPSTQEVRSRGAHDLANEMQEVKLWKCIGARCDGDGNERMVVLRASTHA